MLAEHGAVVFDADVLAREATQPGTFGYERVVGAFGAGAIGAGGALDRERLAAIVFADPGARRELEGIVHPEVFRLLAEGLAPYRGTDRTVVFDAPLIVEAGFSDACDLLVVVSAPAEARIERLAATRGMPREEAEARIAAQGPPEEKERRADVVLANEGSLEELRGRVDELWTDMERRKSGAAGGSSV
jgi:dephospho-CoA kinase